MTRPGRAPAKLLLTLALVGCGTTRHNTEQQPPPTPPLQATGGSGGGAPVAPAVCPPPPPALVRLSFNELVQSARSLLGDQLGDEMTAAIGGLREPTFPPLASPDDGPSFNESTFDNADRLAQIAGRYVREHFELTKCADDDFACVERYVAGLAERAFRRPLSSDERAALLQPVKQAETVGALASHGAEYGVYAIFESPHFVYRTELGADPGAPSPGELRLTDHELASALAFFLTGGPPDPALLAVAAAGTLTQDEELATQVARLSATDASRQHFQALLAAHFGLDKLAGVVIDPAAAGIPVSGELRQSMHRELEAFLSTELWSGGVGNLLTSRRSRLDEGLASLYGVSFPPAGTIPDETGFVDWELPEERAGLLTRAGWSTMTSRPVGTSVVGRGLQVMRLLCESQPAVPDLEPNVQEPPDMTEASEREKAEYRWGQPSCRTCHLEIDPLGLALEDLDMLGRYRSTDPQGRAIQASVKLPAFAGGASVNGARELSEALPEELLARCLSQQLLVYALSFARGSTDCERDALVTMRAQSGDQSLPAIIEQVALSRTFRLRSR